VDYTRGRRTCLHILRASSPDLPQWSGRQLRSKATAEPSITLRNLEKKLETRIFGEARNVGAERSLAKRINADRTEVSPYPDANNL